MARNRSVQKRQSSGVKKEKAEDQAGMADQIKYIMESPILWLKSDWLRTTGTSWYTAPMAIMDAHPRTKRCVNPHPYGERGAVT